MRGQLRAERAFWQQVTALIDAVNAQQDDPAAALRTAAVGIANLTAAQADIELNGHLVRANSVTVLYDGPADDTTRTIGALTQPLGTDGVWGRLTLAGTADTDRTRAALRVIGTAVATVIDNAAAHTSHHTTTQPADLYRLNRAGITLTYRPVVHLTTGQVLAAEAIVSWEHPTAGTIGDDQILRMVEPTALLPEYTAHVVGEAITAAGLWHSAGYDLTVTVNVAGKAITAEFAASTLTRLIENDVPPHRLALEIRPGDGVPDGPVVADLLRLGVHLVVDHHAEGTPPILGLQPHGLKVSEDIVARLETDESARAAARKAARLGAEHGMVVSATGVDTDGQRRIAQAVGCHVGQGAALGAPGAADDLLRRMNSGVNGVRGRLASTVADGNVLAFRYHYPDRIRKTG